MTNFIGFLHDLPQDAFDVHVFEVRRARSLDKSVLPMSVLGGRSNAVRGFTYFAKEAVFFYQRQKLTPFLRYVAIPARCLPPLDAQISPLHGRHCSSIDSKMR